MAKPVVKPNFTFEELVEYLTKGSRLDVEGFTVAEFAKQSGKPKRWIQDQIRASDIRCVGKRTQNRIDGSPYHVPVYAFPRKG